MADNFIQWQDKYSVKVKKIDKQHMKLINMINELYDAYINKKQSDKVSLTINQMIEYAALHFMTEEKYFIKYEFNDSINHIKEHKYFIQKINEFQEEHKQNKSSLSLEVLYFLQDWLINHILVSDKKYIDCFKNGGLS
jgi:hemerythrin